MSVTPATLQIELKNNTSSQHVFTSITGKAIDQNGAWFLLQKDGNTPYYPQSPSSDITPINQDCAIPLGGPGSSTTVTIPHLAGGRIYLSVDKPLLFFLNPGPALVEPSVTNTSDKNYGTNWGFCEFTYDHAQLYANISYVDFVSLPISMSLINASGDVKSVLGMPPDGLDRVCAAMEAQTSKDGKEWKSLIVKSSSQSNLRLLSPNQGMVGTSNFANYYDQYIDRVWSRFSSSDMHINTQAAFGIVSGRVSNDVLVLDDQQFAKPFTPDIFSANSGPFVTGANAKRNAIIPRLNAEFNRSTLLHTDTFPASKGTYYLEDVTNHYARVVHDLNLDGRGYAHPYDDVNPDGGSDQSGAVHDPAPVKLSVFLGGAGQQ